jgi:hypothetical protein
VGNNGTIFANEEQNVTCFQALETFLEQYFTDMPLEV